MKNEIPQHKKSTQAAFLAAYRTCASVTKAAQAAGMDRSHHYVWLRDDDEYLVAFEAAKEQATQTLEDEAVRRAFEGIDDPIVWQGQICGTVKRYSDTLLIFLLKGLRLKSTAIDGAARSARRWISVSVRRSTSPYSVTRK